MSKTKKKIESLIKRIGKLNDKLKKLRTSGAKKKKKKSAKPAKKKTLKKKRTAKPRTSTGSTAADSPSTPVA